LPTDFSKDRSYYKNTSNYKIGFKNAEPLQPCMLFYVFFLKVKTGKVRFLGF